VAGTNAKLVYDVGLHDGSDTAYYLRLGFRVIAIEADTGLADAAADRFAREIAAGQLEIVNVGISAQRGVARFWVCDDHSEWSSFDREIAARRGCAHHPIDIPTLPFDAVLKEYGIPHYCKIDIEGNDYLCLAAMEPELCPAYVSVELARAPGTDLLSMLSELGYKRFKIIDQTRFCSVEPKIQRLLHERSPIGAATRRINRLRSRSSHRGWRFPPGSSGAIGPATPGRWLHANSIRDIWSWVDEHQRDIGLTEWFDLDAAL
jgi:FkbM family methyltransferase